MFSGVFQKLAAEAFWQEDGANLIFQRNIGATTLRSFEGDVAHFADANACGADGFKEQGEPCAAEGFSCGEELVVVGAGELTRTVTEEGALDAQITNAQSLQPLAVKKLCSAAIMLLMVTGA